MGSIEGMILVYPILQITEFLAGWGINFEISKLALDIRNIPLKLSPTPFRFGNISLNRGVLIGERVDPLLMILARSLMSLMVAGSLSFMDRFLIAVTA